jgi:hypothetical protein
MTQGSTTPRLDRIEYVQFFDEASIFLVAPLEPERSFASAGAIAPLDYYNFSNRTKIYSRYQMMDYALLRRGLWKPILFRSLMHNTS